MCGGNGPGGRPGISDEENRRIDEDIIERRFNPNISIGPTQVENDDSGISDEENKRIDEEIRLKNFNPNITIEPLRKETDLGGVLSKIGKWSKLLALLGINSSPFGALGAGGSIIKGVGAINRAIGYDPSDPINQAAYETNLSEDLAQNELLPQRNDAGSKKRLLKKKPIINPTESEQQVPDLNQFIANEMVPPPDLKMSLAKRGIRGAGRKRYV